MYIESVWTDFDSLHQRPNNNLYIKTHDSESRGQEEAAVRDEQVSYLHVAPL